MTRARDGLYLLRPHRFYTRGLADGDNHVYAPRTRFIPETLLHLFDTRMESRNQEVSAVEGPLRGRVDVHARLQEMWT